MRWWKLIGLAGFAGVAATGVVIARAERRRRAYTPDEIRERLRSRLDESAATAADTAEHAGQGRPAGPSAANSRSRAALASLRDRAAAVRIRAAGLRSRAAGIGRRTRQRWGAPRR